MNRRAKAPSSASSMRRGSHLACIIRGALAFAFVLAAFLGGSASAALADNTPSLTTNPAESVGVTTAKLSGSVNPNGESGAGTTSWRLEYTPAGAGTWSTANSGEITGTEAEEANPVPVEAIFGFTGELQPGAEYEFRLAAENGTAPLTSSPRSFTMQAATAPLLTAGAAGAVEYTTAALHGELDPAGGNENPIASEVLPIHWQLQYSPAGQGSWSTGGGGTIEGAEAQQSGTPIPLSAPLPSGGLQPGTEYESRLLAFYSSPAAPLEAASGAGPVFTTLTVSPPLVATDDASAVTASSATLSGEVTAGGTDPAFTATTCDFEYISEAAYKVTRTEQQKLTVKASGGTFTLSFPTPSGQNLTTASLPFDASAAALQAALQALASIGPGAVIVSGGPGDPGANHPYTIDFTGPLALRNLAQISIDVSKLDAGSDSKVETNTEGRAEGFDGAVQAPCNATPEGTSGTPVEAEATGLEPHQTYHLRLSAKNAGGTTATDAPHTFITAAIPPEAIARPAREIESDRATLAGLINPHNDPTEYWFLWGQADCEANPGSCQSLPLGQDAAAGPGNPIAHVSQLLTGLDPETSYDFILFARNSAGTAEGAKRTFTTAAPQSGECPNQPFRSEQSVGYLPECRAYELVSSAEKNGLDIFPESTRSRASAGESPGLPPAFSYTTLVAFGDAHGTGGETTEYLARRAPAPGTQGWATHAITPPQEAVSFLGEAAGGGPVFLETSNDLTKAVFRSWSPLSDAPNVAHVPALYRREDLRTPGVGTYSLLSDSTSVLPPRFFGQQIKQVFHGASTDFQHVLFESHFPLRAATDEERNKLYLSDSAGVPRLVLAGPNCGFEPKPRPCSAAGKGSAYYSPRTLSSDGSRVEFSDPVTEQGVMTTPGAASRAFQLDNNGTPATADDALIQLNASEASSPEATGPAAYQTASTDGNRVFFISPERLTDAAPPAGGLYMWERQDENEAQRLSVDATGGTFTLTAHAQPTIGRGEITEGSNEVTNVESGSFMVGQTLSGPGIPVGTRVQAMRPGNMLLLTQEATETTYEATIHADIEATTQPLAYDASAAEVQTALEALATDPVAPEEARGLIGEGNVQVSGGPGSPDATTPYEIEFTGALVGVDVRPLTADAGGLTGAGSTATLTVPNPARNLSYIAPMETETATDGVIGASEDGHHIYFATENEHQQLVPGAPTIPTIGTAYTTGIYYWQDAAGPPAGTLSYVGAIPAANIHMNTGRIGGAGLQVSRVSADGGTLLFQASRGDGLVPRYDHGHCGSLENPLEASGTCAEAYVYRAEDSTPTRPEVLCASCLPGGGEPTGNAEINARESILAVSRHLDRALTADGDRVFFTTPDALVSDDTNGVSDVYVFDVTTAEAHLISSGTDPAPAKLLEASADGHDVYFATRARLLGWDRDGAYDVYDARIGGGFSEPPPPPHAPCLGETCREASDPAPRPASVGSTQPGPGNPKPKPLSCPKGRRPVHRHGRTRCVKKKQNKKHHRKHERTANAHRRAGK